MFSYKSELVVEMSFKESFHIMDAGQRLVTKAHLEPMAQVS